MKTTKYKYPLLDSVHRILPPPTAQGETYYTCDAFQYFHYGCDGVQDAGWGCGYRTLQSIASWVINKRNNSDTTDVVPSIADIQQVLINIDDKPSQFLGSSNWIGSLEVFYVLDVLFDVPCRVLHEQLNDSIIEKLREYFVEYGGLIMMGGMTDTASKAIAGMHISSDGLFLLIVDPHYLGIPNSAQELIDVGFIRWTHISDFDHTFYNLCMPLLK